MICTVRMFLFPFKIKAFLTASATHQDNSSLQGYIFLFCHQSCQTKQNLAVKSIRISPAWQQPAEKYRNQYSGGVVWYPLQLAFQPPKIAGQHCTQSIAWGGGEGGGRKVLDTPCCIKETSCNTTTGTTMSFCAALLVLSCLFIYPLIHWVTVQSYQEINVWGSSVKAGLHTLQGWSRAGPVATCKPGFILLCSDWNLSQSVCQ